MRRKRGHSRRGPARCDDLRPLLVAYLTHELGGARAALVREHIRTCDACRREAAELASTLGALRDAESAPSAADPRLTPARRRAVLRAVLHPLSAWLFRRHVWVSLAAALIALIALLVWLRGCRLWHEPDTTGYPVRIGGTPPGKVAPP